MGSLVGGPARQDKDPGTAEVSQSVGQ